MALEETAADTLDHSPSRASSGHTAVLNVPKDAHRGDVFRAATLWRT